MIADGAVTATDLQDGPQPCRKLRMMMGRGRAGRGSIGWLGSNAVLEPGG